MRVRSNRPGIEAQAFISISRMALPMVALARFPGPNRLPLELMSNSREIGPLTMTRTAAPPWLDDGAIRLNSLVSMASVAAMTTGKYSGRQPAITALAATFATLISLRRSGTAPSTSSAGRCA